MKKITAAAALNFNPKPKPTYSYLSSYFYPLLLSLLTTYISHIAHTTSALF